MYCNLVETDSLILLRGVKVFVVGGLWFETGLIEGLFSQLIVFVVFFQK